MKRGFNSAGTRLDAFATEDSEHAGGSASEVPSRFESKWFRFRSIRATDAPDDIFFVIRHSAFCESHYPCRMNTFRFRHSHGNALDLVWPSAFKITTGTGKLLLIDPWITNPVFARGKDELAALDHVDLILLTHGHSDHVGNAVEIGKRTGASLVSNFELNAAMISVLGYPEAQARNETTGHLGGRAVAAGWRSKSAVRPGVARFVH